MSRPRMIRGALVAAAIAGSAVALTPSAAQAAPLCGGRATHCPPPSNDRPHWEGWDHQAPQREEVLEAISQELAEYLFDRDA